MRQINPVAFSQWNVHWKQTELDSESATPLETEYKNDVLIQSEGNIETIKQNTTLDTLNNKSLNLGFDTSEHPKTENNPHT